MGQRQVHVSHIWSLTDNACKGCGVQLTDPKAAVPCPQVYAPPPSLAKEFRKP